MSKRLNKNKAYLNLLLSNTDKRQQNALIHSITHEQLNALGEIFYNLLHIVPMNKEEEKIVKKSRKITHKLSLISKAYTTRRKVLLGNKLRLLRLLLHFKAKLLPLLDAIPLND